MGCCTHWCSVKMLNHYAKVSVSVSASETQDRQKTTLNQNYPPYPPQRAMENERKNEGDKKRKQTKKKERKKEKETQSHPTTITNHTEILIIMNKIREGV